MLVYDERLRLLPGYLQQLEMESNGKGVDREGRPLARPTAPVTWGELGTNAQHTFFQALHQGVDVVPSDFVAAIRPAHGLAAHHAALLANLLAQSAALMRGSAEGEPWRRSPGDRPSSIVLLDALIPNRSACCSRCTSTAPTPPACCGASTPTTSGASSSASRSRATCCRRSRAAPASVEIDAATARLDRGDPRPLLRRAGGFSRRRAAPAPSARARAPAGPARRGAPAARR